MKQGRPPAAALAALHSGVSRCGRRARKPFEPSAPLIFEGKPSDISVQFLHSERFTTHSILHSSFKFAIHVEEQYTHHLISTPETSSQLALCALHLRLSSCRLSRQCCRLSPSAAPAANEVSARRKSQIVVSICGCSATRHGAGCGQMQAPHRCIHKVADAG